MIDRYTNEPMRTIWSEETKFRTYLTIEILNAEAWYHKGIMAKEEFEAIRDNADFTLARILELERDTGHDVIAFTRAVSESLGPESRFIHYGLTSTDVVDTALGLRLKMADRVLLDDIEELLKVLKTKAFRYKKTPIIGRTHGMHADITTFGLKFALWYDDMERNLARFKQAMANVEVGKLSGAVGNYAFADPEVEKFVCERLGLETVPISTQVIQRDRHAEYIAVVALIGTVLEKIATEIRNLQRTEIGEVQEAFKDKQKGSSAMPHKHNPIASENICGLARLLRGYVIPAYEDVSLWHERDISHSSVERVIFPDATGLLDYMLKRYTKTLDELVVNEDRMLVNIQITNGVVYSQRVLNALIDKGMSREAAYDLIQQLAQAALQKGKSLHELLLLDKIVRKYLSASGIDELFDMTYYLANVDMIYDRVFGNR